MAEEPKNEPQENLELQQLIGSLLDQFAERYRPAHPGEEADEGLTPQWIVDKLYPIVQVSASVVTLYLKDKGWKLTLMADNEFQYRLKRIQ